jgi:hypothetical protein
MWSNMFHPEAFVVSLRKWGQPDTQFAISCGRWKPNLEVEYPPTNSNYGTLTMSGYSKSSGGLNLPQISVFGA